MQPSVICSLALIALVVTCTTEFAAGQDQPIPAEALAKMRAAAPDAAPAKPAQPRRLLIYTACKGFVHSAIPHGTAALQVLGEKTGAYESVVSADPLVFRPESLRRFDAVCFNNTTGELFDDPNLKESLLDYVRSGGGVVGIHAATDCFYKWPEFGELMGAYFDGHPWTADCEVAVQVEDPSHPLNAGFPASHFLITDEIYQFRAPYSRDVLRVLLSLDTSQTDMNRKGIRRGDGDFAVSWVRTYGLGRVFYCSLGHNEAVFANGDVLKHYLAGLQFAMGDLPADAAPSAALDDDGWIHLFNGQDLTGWIAKPGSWTVEDGILTRQGGGDIWSEQTFGDFTLSLEFKLASNTNSGVFFRTSDIVKWLYTAIEMQVLDSHGKGRPDKHDCGAIYDCLAPKHNMVKPPGEWNHALITCQGSQITIEMNGRQIIDMNLDEWTEPHQNPDGTPNKFDTAYKDMPRVGHIGLQDHGDPVWYRNIRIKRPSE